VRALTAPSTPHRGVDAKAVSDHREIPDRYSGSINRLQLEVLCWSIWPRLGLDQSGYSEGGRWTPDLRLKLVPYTRLVDADIRKGDLEPALRCRCSFLIMRIGHYFSRRGSELELVIATPAQEGRPGPEEERAGALLLGGDAVFNVEPLIRGPQTLQSLRVELGSGRLVLKLTELEAP